MPTTIAPMRSSILRTTFAVATLAVTLAATSDARADEPQTESPEPVASRRTAWPIVLGASGAALAATSVYFFVQWNDFRERAAVVRVQAAGADRCDGFCTDVSGAEQKANLAAGLSLGTGLASMAAIGSAIAIYMIEGKPSRTAVAPVVAPGYGGAAFVTAF